MRQLHSSTAALSTETGRPPATSKSVFFFSSFFSFLLPIFKKCKSQWWFNIYETFLPSKTNFFLSFMEKRFQKERESKRNSEAKCQENTNSPGAMAKSCGGLCPEFEHVFRRLTILIFENLAPFQLL